MAYAHILHIFNNYHHIGLSYPVRHNNKQQGPFNELLRSIQIYKLLISIHMYMNAFVIYIHPYAQFVFIYFTAHKQFNNLRVLEE